MSNSYFLVFPGEAGEPNVRIDLRKPRVFHEQLLDLFDLSHTRSNLRVLQDLLKHEIKLECKELVELNRGVIFLVKDVVVRANGIECIAQIDLQVVAEDP